MDQQTSDIIKYGVLKPKGETNDRIRETIKKCIWLCQEYNATFVFIEGIQVQRNPKVFEILAKLQGTLEISLEEKGYFVNVVKASEWRRRVGIKNRKRKEVKVEAIQMVKDIYGIQASEDEAEAILFGRAFSEQEKNHGSI